MFETHLRCTLQHLSAIRLTSTIRHKLLICAQRVPGSGAFTIANQAGRLISAYHCTRTGTTTPYMQQHTSNPYTQYQPRPCTIAEVQALHAKWRNLLSRRASPAVLLTSRVGGMLMRRSCVLLLLLFPGPSLFPSFCHRPSTGVRCWLPREIPRGTEPNRRVVTASTPRIAHRSLLYPIIHTPLHPLHPL